MRHFQPFATGYHPTHALWLGQACRLVYRNEAAMHQTALSWGFDRFRYFDRQGTQAFLLGNDKLIVIAFRGTEFRCLTDWLTDLRLELIPGCKGKVHRGFSEALDSIWTQLAIELGFFRHNNQALLMTGHSMGAALATLAAARFAERGQFFDALYTFGSPRVGNPKFAKRFNRAFYDRTFRIVNDKDLVTRVPPRSFGFQHVGKLIYFDQQGDLQTNSHYWDTFLEEVQGGIDEFMQAGMECIADHDMEHYSKVLSLGVSSKQAIAIAGAR